MSDSQGFPPPPPPPVLPPTGDGRLPPPWERDGQAVQRYIDTIRNVLMQPAPFFRSMRREGGLGAPLVYALIGVLIGSVGAYLTQMMTPFGGMAGGQAGALASLIMVPVFALCGLFIVSGIVHVLLLLVAGTKQPFETTFRVAAYTSGSTSPLNLIPFVGGLVGGIWALILLVIGMSEAHEVPQGQAAIAVLLPAVICCGIGILFGGAMLALIFGAAAAGMR